MGDRHTTAGGRAGCNARFVEVASAMDQIREVITHDGGGEGQGSQDWQGFTDGSLRRSRTGPVLSGLLHRKEDPQGTEASAAIIWQNEGREAGVRLVLDRDLVRDTSSTTLENMALVAEALIRGSATQGITLHSDSKGAIAQYNRLAQTTFSQVGYKDVMTKTPNATLWELLRRTGGTLNANLQWVKAHIEKREKDRSRWTEAEKGNWKADQLAGEPHLPRGAEGAGLVYGPVVEVTYSEFLEWVVWDLEGRGEGAREEVSELYGLTIENSTTGACSRTWITEPVRAWLRRECSEREWEGYVAKRDKGTSKRRKWSHIAWHTFGEIWRKTGGATSNKQKRLTALAWALDWAPTGELKQQRGYEGDHACGCGMVNNPSKQHILTQCTAVIDRAFWDEMNTGWNNTLKSDIGRAFLMELRRWVKYHDGRRLDMSGSKWHLQAHMAEDLLSGIWSSKLLSVMAGEVEARLGGEVVSDGEGSGGEGGDDMLSTHTSPLGSDDSDNTSEGEAESEATQVEVDEIEGSEGQSVTESIHSHLHHKREELEAFRREFIDISVQAASKGWEIWRTDYERRQRRKTTLQAGNDRGREQAPPRIDKPGRTGQKGSVAKTNQKKRIANKQTSLVRWLQRKEHVG